MLNLVLSFLLGNIPNLFFFFWASSFKKEDTEYKGICRKALLNGFVITLPVFLLSTVFVIIERFVLTGLHPIILAAFRSFFAFAFTEELFKFLYAKKTMNKTPYPYSWMDYWVVFTLVAVGFAIIENFVLGLTSSPAILIVRAVTPFHLLFGLIIGYHVGKDHYTHSKKYTILVFILAIFLHGLYDFLLADALLAYEWIAFVVLPYVLALDILLIVLLLKLNKARKKEEFITPIE